MTKIESISSRRPVVASSVYGRAEDGALALRTTTKVLSAAATPDAVQRVASDFVARVITDQLVGRPFRAVANTVVALPFALAASIDAKLRGAKATREISAAEIHDVTLQYNQATPYRRAHIAELAQRWLSNAEPDRLEPGAVALLQRIVKASHDPASTITDADRNEARAAVDIYQWLLSNFAMNVEAIQPLPAGPLTQSVLDRALKGLDERQQASVKRSVLNAVVDHSGEVLFEVHPNNAKSFDDALVLLGLKPNAND